MLVLLPLCLVLAGGTALSGDKKEQKKLEGAWTLVELIGGKEKKDEKMKAVFKGDKLTMMHDGQVTEAKYTVDPGKKPATMDVRIDKDGEKETFLCIYQVDGDMLKICHFEGDKSTKERPEKFVSNKDTMLAVLKREKN
jgi:uncharacterized protein (TIGR03067 family)